MNQLYYLCFSVNKLPDLTLTKYSVFDGSSVENIMDKHGVFLRQLHRLGYTSGVYFCIIITQIEVFRQDIICPLFFMQQHKTEINLMV